MKFDAHDRILFIGDSITDCGRNRPIGESNSGLGSGYPQIINAILNGAHPEKLLHIINTGISGNRVRDLKERWESDVMDLKPDWVSICIGINDVWHQFISPAHPELAVFPDEYESTLDELLSTTKIAVKGMIVMSPYYICTDMNDQMRQRMDEYGRICRKLADKHGAIFVDLQQVFDNLLKYRHSYYYAGDRVHPNPAGHGAIAAAFLKAVGFSW